MLEVIAFDSSIQDEAYLPEHIDELVWVSDILTVQGSMLLLIISH